jgi:hypothetical protein
VVCGEGLPQVVRPVGILGLVGHLAVDTMARGPASELRPPRGTNITSELAPAPGSRE